MCGRHSGCCDLCNVIYARFEKRVRDQLVKQGHPVSFDEEVQKRTDEQMQCFADTLMHIVDYVRANRQGILDI